MANFVESPWPVLFIGIAVEAALAYLLLQTGRSKLLFAMLGVAVLVGAGLVVERWIVTDREAVEQTLDAAVAAVKKNNLDGVLGCILPTAQNSNNLARWVFGRFEFEDGHISDLEIKVNRMTSPPTATAKFLAVGKGRDRKGECPYQGFAQRVTVQLRLQGGRWLVTDHELKDLRPN